MYPPLQHRYSQIWHHFKGRVDANIKEFKTFEKDYDLRLVYQAGPKIDLIAKILKDIQKTDLKKRHLNEEAKDIIIEKTDD